MSTPPNDLPAEAIAAYAELSAEQKAAFGAYFDKNRRSMGFMVALAILLPIQLFLLGKVALGILFWITGGGFGIWYVIEWFLTPGRVRDFNAGVARDGLALIGYGGDTTPPATAATEEE